MRMGVKVKTKKSYNKSANWWIASRKAKNLKNEDPLMLKQNRPHFFIEKPAMRSKIPDLSGKRVLCLGCGSGEECKIIEEFGALEIVGVDISDQLIKEARQNFPNHKFLVMDAEEMTFDDNSFDFVFSSLVMHYFKNWSKVLGQIYRVLKPNGVFLFSTLHPVKWSSTKLNDEDGKAYACITVFEKDRKTGKQKIYGDCLNIKKVTETWMKSLTVTLYPRSITEMFRPLFKAGFEVVDIYEPKAIEETKKYDMEYYLVNQKIPNFVIFEVKKRVK